MSLDGSNKAGRRGLAGVVFVHKVAGAAAALGYVDLLKPITLP